MIVSVHIADVGLRQTLSVLRRRPDRAGATPGLRYAETAVAVPLSPALLPARPSGRVALIAAWDDDAAFERFLIDDPIAATLGHGWHVRLEPLRAWGAWPALPDLPTRERSTDDQPVAVLTLGRLRLSRLGPFLAASARAEGEAISNPALLASTGLARPPRLVATFSLWRTSHEMRAYALGERPGGHRAALRAHQHRSFHHEAVFVRLRPYAARGTWDGRNPLPSVAETPQTVKPSCSSSASGAIGRA